MLMAISDFIPTIHSINPQEFLSSWNPLGELQNNSITPPTVLIQGQPDLAKLFAAELIAALVNKFPNMYLFVIPATPEGLEGEIDKTTEVMTWLSDTRNRGIMPDVVDSETPIPLVYLSNVTDLYSETSLARMVKRSRFLGMVVVAIANSIDSESKLYPDITEMFTHVVNV